MFKKHLLVNKINEVAKILSHSPNERKLFDIFEGLYHCVKNESEEFVEKYELQYLMLKCIHYPNAENYCNIANYYLETENNRFLCFLSDLAVLRQNLTDRKFYERAAAFAKVLFKEREHIQKRISTTNNCDISVIMPTYNRGDIIGESIESVLNQKYKNFELIVVNDGGDDRVKTTVQELNDARIKYIKIKHSGLSGALNAGLREAKGKYVSYLDDDDIYYPNHLATLIKIAKEKNRDFVYSKSKVILGFRNETVKFVPVKESKTNTSPYSKTTLATQLGISILNVLHKRSLINKAGFLNENLPWSMDWDYWMSMSDVTEPYFVDEWTSEYRKTLDNMTTLKYYQAVFYMQHLLKPYFCTAYGALTLYKSACLLKKKDSYIWIEKLSQYFLSQDEILQTFFHNKKMLFNFRFLSQTLLLNKYRREYSLMKFLKQTLKSIVKTTIKILKN